MDGFYEVVSRLCPTIGVEELAGAAVRFVLAKRKAKTALVPNEAIPDYFKQPGSRGGRLRREERGKRLPDAAGVDQRTIAQ